MGRQKRNRKVSALRKAFKISRTMYPGKRYSFGELKRRERKLRYPFGKPYFP